MSWLLCDRCGEPPEQAAGLLPPARQNAGREVIESFSTLKEARRRTSYPNLTDLAANPHPGSAQSPRDGADWRRCAEITRAYGRTFFFASRFLPPDRRRAIHATYAYCRIADDIADRSTDPVAAAHALDAWERPLDAPTDPIAVAFATVRSCHGVPVDPVREMLAGVRMDLVPCRFATWEELRRYCYRVAGTVGLMVAPILGCRDEGALPHAVDLGIAMQLTNILRDIGEDARRGRLYLPLEELAAFECDPEAIVCGKPNGRFADLLAFEIALARALYANARRGLPALSPSGRLTALAGSELYATILNRIEEMDYNVLEARAHVSTRCKLRALPGIATTFARLSWSLSTRDPF